MGLQVSQSERLISDYLANKKVLKSGKVIKVSMNGCKVVYNTIKKALKIFQKTDINYDIRENKTEAYYEIIVRINEKSPQASSKDEEVFFLKRKCPHTFCEGTNYL